ncbi:MAG: hypothetical protein SangKO_040480 [Sandaracinaceae bacterium]
MSSAEKKREDAPRLIEALAERLEAKLGPHASRAVDAALADEVDRLAEKVAEKVARAVTEGAPIEDLGWDDEKQTVQQPLEQMQRFRQIAAMSQPPRGSLTNAPVLGALRKTAPKQGWVKPDDRSSGIREAVHIEGADPMGITVPRAAPLSLADMAETAPRDAVSEDDADEALETPDADATAEHDALSQALAREERATVPARPPRVTEAPRLAQLPESPPEVDAPRRRLAPFVGLAVILLVVAVAIAAALVFGASSLTEQPGEVTRGAAPTTASPAAAPPIEAPEREAPASESEAESPESAQAPESEPGAEDEASARERSDALVRDGQLAEREGRWEAARVAYQQAFEVHEANPHAVAGLARERLTAGDAEGALAHAERAVQLRRRRASYRVLLGDARRMGGDIGGARRAYERALELDPEDAEARRRLGR